MSKFKNFKDDIKQNIGVVEKIRERSAQTTFEVRKMKRVESVMKQRNIGDKYALNQTAALASGQRVRAFGVPHTLQPLRGVIRILKAPQFSFIDHILKTSLWHELMKHLNVNDTTDTPNPLNVSGIFSAVPRLTFALTGVEPLLKNLAVLPSTLINKEKITILCNIISDGFMIRELVLRHGFLPPLLDMIKPDASETVLVITSYTISNLCQHLGKQLQLPSIRMILDSLNVLIQQTNLGILMASLTSVCYIIEDSINHIPSVVASGIVPKLIALFVHEHLQVQVVAVRAVAIIALGDVQQTKALVDSGVLPPLVDLLRHGNERVRIEACWLALNIAVGSPEHVQAIIENNIHAGILHILRIANEQSCSNGVQKDALSFVMHVVFSDNREHILALIKANLFVALTSLIDCQITSLIVVVLKIVLRILQLAAQDSTTAFICGYIALSGAKSKLMQLQSHNFWQINTRARHIIHTYFN